MEVRSQPQLPATILQGKDSQYELNRSSGGPQGRSGSFGEGKNVMSCRERNSVTIPTPLSCLHVAQDGDVCNFRLMLLRKGKYID
jgi:hypothetical protein